MSAPLDSGMVTWQAVGSEAVGVTVGSSADLIPGLGALELPRSRPVVVLVGGAGGLTSADLDRLRPLIADGLIPVLEQRQAVVVDGGTDAGIMRVIGEERIRRSAAFPLVGVVAHGTVRWPGRPASDDTAELERHHTHFVVVPGSEWGAEAPWIARTATALAGAASSVTVLVNGGEIAFADVANSVEARRPTLVVSGSGRAADQFAAALRGEPADERAEELVASRLVFSAPLDPERLRAAIASALDRGGP
ncbi:hypothetical protein ACWF0M_01560 [Kribbella sp. NPDC055110]